MTRKIIGALAWRHFSDKFSVRASVISLKVDGLNYFSEHDFHGFTFHLSLAHKEMYGVVDMYFIPNFVFTNWFCSAHLYFPFRNRSFLLCWLSLTSPISTNQQNSAQQRIPTLAELSHQQEAWHTPPAHTSP